MRNLLAAIALVAVTATSASAQGDNCRQMTVTAYSRQMFPGMGAHGRPVVGETAAASSNIAAGAIVWIEGFGQRLINDRGVLGNTGWIDMFVETTAEAVQIGRSIRTVCQ